MSKFDIDINAKLLQLWKAKQSEGHNDDKALCLVWGDVFSWMEDPKNSTTKTFDKELKRLFGVSMKTKIVDVEIWNGLLGEIKIKVEELQTAEQERIREKMEKKMTSEQKKPTTEDQVSFVTSPQEQPRVDLENTQDSLEEEYVSFVGNFDDELYRVKQEGSKKDVLNFLLGFRDGFSKNEKMNETKYYTQGYTKGMSMTAIAADDDDDWVE